MLFLTLPESLFCMLTNKTETKLTNAELTYKSQLQESQLMIVHMLETMDFKNGSLKIWIIWKPVKISRPNANKKTI